MMLIPHICISVSKRHKAIASTTHLLREHNNTTRKRRPAHTRNSKQLNEPLKVARALQHLKLLDKLAMDVVQVPRRLDLRVAQTLERLECLPVAVVLHVPARGLGAEVDADGHGDGGDEGRA